ncbi:WbqC-like protein [Clostridiales bacterium oral taxon 876 str. F0540]|nr:WbqC-like protein [Clostridiales bacterium oral taxon 876 str. F0540]
MQPYFFPYIGYWQLINSVDKFVVYDNIQFTKGGWIKRNRILYDGKDKLFSLSIKKDSDYLDVRDRILSDKCIEERKKILNNIKIAYKKAPQFENAFPIIEKCINFENMNLFEYVYNSIIKIKEYLNISTEIIISSNIQMNHALRNKYRVMETCKVLGADIYINPIGGIDLYKKDEFSYNGIDLRFMRTNDLKYNQFNCEFVPNLSIIDVMMFNSIDEIKKLLGMYELV